jgi:hypothetical protein
VVRSLDVVWLAAHFAKFSALNAGKLEMLKETSSATDIELRWCVGTPTIAPDRQRNGTLPLTGQH